MDAMGIVPAVLKGRRYGGGSVVGFQRFRGCLAGGRVWRQIILEGEVLHRAVLI